MKNRKRTSLPTQALATTARGPVGVRILHSDATQAAVEIAVNYNEAEVPSRAYYADYCDVQKTRLGYILIFGKLVGTRTLRTKIEIAYPKEMFFSQLWATSRDLNAIISQIPRPSEGQPELSELVDTDKVQTFRSNNVFMGCWGEDSVMDFYYLSPKDMHGLRSNQRFEASLEPIVRVAMDTALLNEFFDLCKIQVEAAVADGAKVVVRGGANA